MGQIVQRNRPCLNTVECGSHDARQVYAKGDSFCFSCKQWFPPQHGEDLTPDIEEPKMFKKKKDVTEELAEIEKYSIRGFKDRKIPKDICEFFGVKVSYGEDGEIDTHYYPYNKGKAYKVRDLPKNFRSVGPIKDCLFGQEKFAGGGKRLVITEGEIDALSVAAASMHRYKKIYPVVSIPSGTGTKALIENREWVRSFTEVVLFLDNDKTGEEATNEAIRIIGMDKVKLVQLGEYKDANEVLLKEQNGLEKIMQVIFDATSYVPSGIMSKEAMWEQLVAYNNTPSVPYPDCIKSVNEKVKGMRKGEIALFTSGTSCGKSTIMREIMLHLHNETSSKIGIVSLEESPAETARKLSGMQLLRNPAKEEIPLEELKVGFDQVFGDDRYIVLDHQGSLKDEAIFDKLEYMALSGAEYIIIDHITILVSEGAGDLTGNEAIDKIMNDLLRFVKKRNVWIGLVSHLRKTTNTGKAFEEGRMPNLDDIKGSGSIKQVSFDIIAFARNLQDEDLIVRNTIDISVLKCRFTGLTGPVKGAYYDYNTGRFTDVENAPQEEFVSL